MTRGKTAGRPRTGPRFQLVRIGPQSMRWRLLGGNNASLGAGVAECAAPPECLLAITVLRARLDVLSADFRHVSGGRWRWSLRWDGEPVAEATHAYGRRIEAQRGLDRFRVAAVTAGVEDIETVVDWRQRYRRHPDSIPDQFPRP
ncbi:YegP family protein [Amycolatopsis sp. OK19-0408]|uniref:YegP family protein n=1 Tax=Amycolatopsis iheyensis TaxID=2945988 RepID=A0A9X2NIQ7_9PSEU|nr:YegP family protein [Amycolatopsis iheyensis]MCR6487369.1 YegP family protein [Amycolatopsis iheyensis]